MFRELEDYDNEPVDYMDEPLNEEERRLSLIIMAEYSRPKPTIIAEDRLWPHKDLNIYRSDNRSSTKDVTSEKTSFGNTGLYDNKPFNPYALQQAVKFGLNNVIGSLGDNLANMYLSNIFNSNPRGVDSHESFQDYLRNTQQSTPYMIPTEPIGIYLNIISNEGFRQTVNGPSLEYRDIKDYKHMDDYGNFR